MAFLDGLIGAKSVRKQRRLADEFANKMYDPTVLAGQVSESMRLGTEGLATDAIRENIINQIFQRNLPNDAAAFGGNSASFISAMGAADQSLADALSQAELNLSIEDEQAKAMGREKYAAYTDQQRQLSATREAKLVENRMLMEMELDNRRRKLISGVLQTGIAAATLFKPPTTGIDSMFGINESVQQEQLSNFPSAMGITDLNPLDFSFT